MEPHTIRLAQQMRSWGWSIPEIADALWATDKQVQIAVGLKPGRKPWCVVGTKYSASEVKTIKEMAANGFTAADIGLRLGRTKNSIIGFCWRHDIRLGRRTGGQYGPRKSKSTTREANYERA